jgi:lipoate-protein ligase B
MISTTIPAMHGRPDRREDRRGDRGTAIPATLRIDGPVAYQVAVDILERAARERAENTRPDWLWLLEHHPVFTIGRNSARSGRPSEGRASEISGVPLLSTGRGGSLTYHGPGQVVAYPVLRLKHHCPGAKAYVRNLEEVVLRVLRDWGITGHRIEGFPGVWVGTAPPEKIASIGVRISRGITTHGVALNVDMDLAPFSLIDPCGIPGCHVTSMSRLLGIPIAVREIKCALVAAFADLFQLAWVEGPAWPSAAEWGQE